MVRREDATGKRLAGVPLLVVEVQSPSTRTVDLTLKRRVFEEAGVASYWLVEPDALILTVLELDVSRCTSWASSPRTYGAPASHSRSHQRRRSSAARASSAGRG